MNNNDLTIPNSLSTRTTIFNTSNNINYSLDVNETTLIYSLKKIFQAASHFPKNSYRIYHKGNDLTDLDDFPLNELFPSDPTIEFDLEILDQSLLPETKDSSILKLKFIEKCNTHKYKYLSFYCYTCQESICFECKQSNHNKHNIIEKYDYLQPSENLIEKLFQNEPLFNSLQHNNAINDLNKDKCSELFNKLKDMLRTLELKVNDLQDKTINFINQCEKNMKVNPTLIKKYCTSGLNELKEDIGKNQMITEESVFLTFDKKYRELSKQKKRIQRDNDMYTKVYSNINKINNFVNCIYNDIFNSINKYINNSIYEQVNQHINDNYIHKITKEEIYRNIFNDINVPRKSLIKKEIKKSFINKTGHNFSFSEHLDNSNNTSSIHDSVLSHNNSLSDLLIGHEQFSLDYLMFPITNTFDVYIIDNQTSKICKRNVNNTQTNTVSLIKEFPKGHAYCNYKNSLYISGGLNDNDQNVSFQLMKYDYHSNTVVMMPQMKYQHYNHTMFAYNDYIYVIGGFNSNKCERFHIISNKWEQMEELISIERQFPILTIYNNYLYVFFGLCQNGYVNTLERININSIHNRWERISNFDSDTTITNTYGCGLILKEDEDILYFFGGKNNDVVSSQVFSYNFNTNAFYSNYKPCTHCMCFTENRFHRINAQDYINITQEGKEIIMTITENQ